MYPTSSSNGNTNPIIISYPLDDDDDHHHHHQPNIIPYNPNSKQEVHHHHSSLFHFPSPYIHYDDHEDIVFQRFHDLLDHQNMAAASNNNDDCNGGKLQGGDCNQQKDIPEKANPRKRSSKKDRHSKINTAQGPRDRRMRLSLQVAGKFFRLQDMLGFDKASKTVEWLLVKSKSAIEELTKSLPGMKHSSSTASSTSECEVVSGVNDGLGIGGGGSNGGGEGQAEAEERVEKNISSTRSSANRKKTTNRALTRKSAFHPLARESREKARARARERVSRKRIMLVNNEAKLPQDSLNREMNGLLWSWSPFENGEESGTQSYNHNNINNNPHLEVLPPHDVEELSSTMIFNYDPHNSGISQEHQFTDFQVYEKPWEAYDNINLC